MITLTDGAIEKVKQLNEEDELQGLMMGAGAGGGVVAARALRVGVRTGGCSGLSYSLVFGEKEDGDWVGEFSGVVVVVDPESAPHLEGAVLDYKEGLQGAGFVFNNPSASRSCGCGQSFT